jgi:hypothetical protein
VPSAERADFQAFFHLLYSLSICYHFFKFYSRERQRLAPYSPKGTPADCGLLGEIKGLHLEVSDEHK